MYGLEKIHLNKYKKLILIINKHNRELIFISLFMSDIKYLNLIQINPTTFNQSQEAECNKIRKEQGDNAYYNIIHSRHHNDLKSRKSVDFRLTDQELTKLQTNGVLFKSLAKPESFARTYLNLYNNDMPVFITSDSILYALHKFYDNYLKNVEQTVMIERFMNLCKSMLDTLYTITPTEQNHTYLRDLEVFFMIPYVILQMNNELRENITTQPTLMFSIDEIRQLCSQPSKERTQKELDEGYKPQTGYSWPSEKKLTAFCNLVFPNQRVDSYSIMNLMRKSPKLNTVFENFKVPDLNQPVVLRFGGESIFNKMIRSLSQFQDIDFKCCGTTIQMNGSTFKPRGHYTETLKLKQYFMAFTWLSKFTVSIDRNKSEQMNAIVLASLISKVGERNLVQLNAFQKFVEKIIGQSDGYTINEFLAVMNDFVPSSNNVNDSFNWILSNAPQLTELVLPQLTKKGKLTKFGDTDVHSTATSFSIIGKGNQIDNLVIQKMIDKQFVDDNGYTPMRKFTSVFDLVYTLFDNKSVEPLIQHRMNNVQFNGRDGYHYNNHLFNTIKECENHEFDHTIYSQELKMLRALTQDRRLAEQTGIFPFYNEHWGRKQAQAQIGHYCEMRHDNVLYLDEVCGARCECEHPDLMIEPVPTFWKEMLTLIHMMKELLGGVNKREMSILINFEKIITNFLVYLDCYLNNKPINETLVNELKSIVKMEYRGSGGPDYDGWYMRLFHSDEIALELKPEISSMMTAVDDDRGPGGIVHLGTGPCQLMYVLVRDGRTGEQKILLGPSYTTYEVITDYNTRLNDEEWKQQYKNYSPLQF
ncbi:DUF3160 protein [Fadolivirus algeromassiliense]|jgi:hypothetical protein|uniref:DUF3160 protein n=1 Tax=Fadolivirus FV1/VV64 TaxID=3070911 RepID=A0A7D3QV25_9VIRU|nr:DUF3160 protein [Fadolivirus algeromassiliense]QKF94667.1 DUF3160 protein [Fadolivirus FV1/VV64]